MFYVRAYTSAKHDGLFHGCSGLAVHLGMDMIDILWQEGILLP
jgi:hypothetical protein